MRVNIMKKFPFLTEWFRRAFHLDNFFPWCKRQARRPRCRRRQPVALQFEPLENRVMLTTVSFSSATYTVAENVSTATITVTLDALPSQTVTVNYGTANGTGTAGRDYTTASGTLTFKASDLTETFTVTILNDGVTEPNETVGLSLTNPTNATLTSPSTATLTITDTHFPVPTSASTPLGIAKGTDGLWFAEYSTNKIAKLTTSGTFTEYSIPTSTSYPADVVPGPDGNFWFTESATSKVGKITPSGAITEYSIAGLSSETIDPYRITSGPDGNLWFTNQGNHPSIYKITTSGSYTNYLLSGATPVDITAGPDGNVWFTALGEVGKITPSGVITTYPVTNFGDKNSDSITLGPDNNLWFTEGSNNKIGRITPLGTISEFAVPTTASLPADITAGPDGNLWFAENSANQMARITPAGVITEYSGRTQSDPYDVALGPDNNIWFTEQNANKIGRFSDLVIGQPWSDPFNASSYVTASGVAGGTVSISPLTGSFVISVPVAVNQSVPLSLDCGCQLVQTPLGGNAALVYVSNTVNVKPILQVAFKSDPNEAVPDQLQADLSWNGGAFSSWTTFGTSGHSAGDTYVMALQVPSAITATGNYSYTMQVQATYGSYTQTRDASGTLAVVVRDVSNPFGNGWSLSILDQIVPVTGGVLYVSGSTGGAQFFRSLGSGFLSPPDNFGTLTQSGSNYTYTTKDQIKYNFNTVGTVVYETSIVDPHGLARTFLYDGSNRLTGIQDPDGSTATFTYSGGNLSTIQAPGSRTTTFNIDTNSNLTLVAFSDNTLRSFSYDGNNRLTNDRYGSISTTYAYTANGTLGTVTLDTTNSSKVTGANTQGLATSPARNLSDAIGVVKDPPGHATSYAYDVRGYLTQRVTSNGGSGTLTETWTRDLAEQPTRYTDARSNATNYSYLYGASAGDLTGVTFADGSQLGFAYDQTFHKPTVITDQRGNKTTQTYNATTGDLTTITDAQNRVTTFSWSGGLLQWVQNPLGRYTSFTYDTARRRQSMQDGLGNRVTYLFDSAGNLTVTIDGNSNRTTTGFDGMGRPISVARPNLGLATMIYNAAGLVTDQTDGGGVRTTSSYDLQGRLTGQTRGAGTPLAQTTTNFYDAAGNVTGVQDPLGNLTQYVYDSLNRLIVSVDPNGDRTTSLLDGMGNVTAVRDPNNDLTQYLYDSLNRQTVTIDALTNRTTSFLDLAGNVTGVQDPRGNLTQYLYDTLNRQSVTIDALLNRTTTLFDVAGNVTGITDPRTNLTQYLVDAVGRQTVTIDALSNATTTLFDAAGNVTGVQDPRSNLTQFLYDALNRRTVTIDALGNRVTSLFDSSGHMTGTQDGLGHLTQYVVDALGRRTVTIDALSNRTTLVLDAADRASVVIDARNNRTTTLYDADGQATVSIDGLSNRTTSLFDAVGNVTGVKDPNSNLTQFVFDADNRKSVTIDALSNRTTTLFDAASNVTGIQDPRSNLTQFVFDADNRKSVTIDALNNRTTTLFDAASNVTGVLDPRSNLTQFVFDADNRKSVTIDALLNRTTTLFDAASNVTGILDARNNLTQFVFDADNRKSVTIDALLNHTTTLFDAASNVTQVTDARSNNTQWLVDALNRQTVTIDAMTKRTTQLFDAAGNMTGVQDANNNLTQFVFDADNRKSVTIDALTHRSTTLFDAAGNVTGVLDGNNNLTQYLLDADNRQSVTIDANGFRTTQLFDAAGNVTSVKDASNNTTTFAFDADNRKTSQTDQLGHTATFAYNAVGLMTATTDRLGRQRTFAYDAANRLTTETWYNADGSLAQRLTATYDAVGNQLTAQNAQGTYTMSYDALNRVTVVNELFSQNLTFTYDAVGNRTLVQDSKNGTETSVYDADNRLQARYFAGISTIQFHLDLTYQDNGLLNTEVRYSLLGGPISAIGRTTLLYDAANRVTSINHTDSAGSTGLVTLAYNYDAGNRLTSEVDNAATRTYTYDIANQLTADSTNTYTYDGTGNRNNGSWSAPAGNNNELQTDPTWTYTYDLEGNETKKSKTGEFWTYGYDNLNHLISAKKSLTDGGTVVQEVDFKYDWFGNRVEKDVLASGITTATQHYALDGWDPAKGAGQGEATSNWDVWADLDGLNTDSLQTRYLRGDVVDQLFARIAWDPMTTSWKPAWLLTDHLGSIVGVTDNSGVLQDTITYDGYGNIASESTSSWGGRYKWTGREVDTEINLQYNRARFYDPKTSRWLSQDPLGFDAGDSNLYRYVNNAPTDATDPSGRELYAGGNESRDYVVGRMTALGVKVKVYNLGFDTERGNHPSVLREDGNVYYIVPDAKVPAGARQLAQDGRPLDSSMLEALTSYTINRTVYQVAQGDKQWYTISGYNSNRGLTNRQRRDVFAANLLWAHEFLGATIEDALTVAHPGTKPDSWAEELEIALLLGRTLIPSSDKAINRLQTAYFSQLQLQQLLQKKQQEPIVSSQLGRDTQMTRPPEYSAPPTPPRMISVPQYTLDGIRWETVPSPTFREFVEGSIRGVIETAAKIVDGPIALAEQYWYVGTLLARGEFRQAGKAVISCWGGLADGVFEHLTGGHLPDDLTALVKGDAHSFKLGQRAGPFVFEVTMTAITIGTAAGARVVITRGANGTFVVEGQVCRTAAEARAAAEAALARASTTNGANRMTGGKGGVNGQSGGGVHPPSGGGAHPPAGGGGGGAIPPGGGGPGAGAPGGGGMGPGNDGAALRPRNAAQAIQNQLEANRLLQELRQIEQQMNQLAQAGVNPPQVLWDRVREIRIRLGQLGSMN
jgi:RHS repeat-associated protein